MLVTLLRIFAYVTAGLAAGIGTALTAHMHSVRWNVKTLADSWQVPSQAVATTIAEQRKLIAPTVDESTPRLADESTLYCLRARLVEAYLEKDRDYHLILQDSGSGEFLVAEIPDGIDPVPIQYRSSLFRARHVVDSLLGVPGAVPFHPDLPPLVEVTGVGFFDSPHVIMPPGMAPNYREIHPVLSIRAIQK